MDWNNLGGLAWLLAGGRSSTGSRAAGNGGAIRASRTWSRRLLKGVAMRLDWKVLGSAPLYNFFLVKVWHHAQ
jgi:hypothetical protein